MKIRLVDILVKIANREPVPQKLKHKSYIYTFDEYKIDYKCNHKLNNKNIYLFEKLMTYRDKCLDCFVEIVEQ